jgi:hypothetical protein
MLHARTHAAIAPRNDAPVSSGTDGGGKSIRARVVFKIGIGLDVRLSGHKNLMPRLLGLVGIVRLHVGALRLLHIFPNFFLFKLISELILELAHVFVVPRLCTRTCGAVACRRSARRLKLLGGGPFAGRSVAPASSPFRLPCTRQWCVEEEEAYAATEFGPSSSPWTDYVRVL